MPVQEAIYQVRAIRDQAPAQARFLGPVYTGTVFLGAFLLLQVELIIGKYLLPWFGGAAAVWTTAMLVFQVLLFASYAYAHAISTRLHVGPRTKFHLGLLAASLLVIVAGGVVWPSPITPGAAWKPHTPNHPILGILLVLITGVGLPFFTLSTTGPLMQEWYSRATAKPPYKLYAVSNLGSLLGLLTYPFVIEPLLNLHVQAWLWSALYLLYTAGVVRCAQVARAPRPMPPSRPRRPPVPIYPPTLGSYVLWIALAAVACLALLAVTSKMCQEVAAVPVLWVFPLCLYLGSFIICFGKQSWYKRGLFHPLFAVALLAAIFSLARNNTLAELSSLGLLLFCVCMVCHGELARLKPEAAHLTAFYLCLSGGGALGGVCAGVIAPALFSTLWEFDIAALSAALLLVIVLLKDKQSWFYKGSGWLVIPTIAVVTVPPLVAVAFDPSFQAMLRLWHYYPAALVLGLPVLAFAVFSHYRSGHRAHFRPVQTAAFAVLLLLLYLFVRFNVWTDTNVVARSRNFYGILSVLQARSDTRLLHGTTVHGTQWRDPAFRRRPTIYYGQNSGIGQMMAYHPKRAQGIPMRIGVVGLGAGTLAAYGRAGDYFRFYELDPGLLPFVQGPKAWFSFLNDSPAKIDVVLGDARLSLERELAAGTSQKFDVLVLDAFNGDAIPTHLLTKEAVRTYLAHLNGPDAILAIHISSATVDFQPVIAGIAREFNQDARVTALQDDTTGMSSVWVMLAANQEAVTTPGLRAYGRALSWDGAVLWTDDFSNLAALLKPLW